MNVPPKETRPKTWINNYGETVHRDLKCEECNGTGRVHSHNNTCWNCHGTGRKTVK